MKEIKVDDWELGYVISRVFSEGEYENSFLGKGVREALKRALTGL